MNGTMAGREGRPGITKWLCINPRAQVGHIPGKVLIIHPLQNVLRRLCSQIAQKHCMKKGPRVTIRQVWQISTCYFLAIFNSRFCRLWHEQEMNYICSELSVSYKI